MYLLRPLRAKWRIRLPKTRMTRMENIRARSFGNSDLKIRGRDDLGRLTGSKFQLVRALGMRLLPSSSHRGRHFACLAVLSRTRVFSAQTTLSTYCSEIMTGIFIKMAVFVITVYNSPEKWTKYSLCTCLSFRGYRGELSRGSEIPKTSKFSVLDVVQEI